MKRIISGILGLAMAASMAVGLSGCGKGNSNTLVWYMAADKPAALEEVMEKVNEIVEPEIGLKLEMKYIDTASYGEKMKLKMASGENFDLMFTGYLSPYHTAVEMGGLMDITDLVEKVKLSEVVGQSYLDAAKVDGRIYAIPNIQIMSNPPDINVPPSVLKDAGVEAQFEKLKSMSSRKAKTIEEMQEWLDLHTELFAAVKANRPELHVWNPTSNIGTTPNYENFGNLVIKRDGSDPTLYIAHETEEWKMGCKTIREWYKAGYIRSDVASAGTSVTTTDRLNYAFLNNTWSPALETGEINSYGEALAHAKYIEPYMGREAALQTMIGVGANAAHPEQAVQFIRLINENKDLYNLLIWGIEGKHYTKEADGSVSVIKDSGYDNVGVAGWKYAKHFNSFTVKGDPLDKWEQYEALNDDATLSPLLGFVPDNSAINAELTNCANVAAEFKAKIFYGTEDFDTWYPEYCAKMEQAGIKKIQEEMQKQYNEFLASK